jgi:hypothetical protein
MTNEELEELKRICETEKAIWADVCGDAINHLEQKIETLEKAHEAAHSLWRQHAVNCGEIQRLERELKETRERLCNEISLRILSEILLEELSDGKYARHAGQVPSPDDLPRLLEYSMWETQQTAKAITELQAEIKELRTVLGSTVNILSMFANDLDRHRRGDHPLLLSRVNKVYKSVLEATDDRKKERDE